MGGTLAAAHLSALARLTVWRERRAARLAQYEALTAACGELQRQLGLPVGGESRPDLTQASLDFVGLEIERLKADKVRLAQAAR